MSRDDLGDLLRETAREPTEPLDARLLVRRGVRQRRRNQMLTSVVAGCALLVGVAGVVASDAPDVAFRGTASAPQEHDGQTEVHEQALVEACAAGRTYVQATQESQLPNRVTPEDDARIADSLRAFSEAAMESSHDGLIAAAREMAAADEEAASALSSGQVPDSDTAAALERGAAARDDAARICRDEAGIELF